MVSAMSSCAITHGPTTGFLIKGFNFSYQKKETILSTLEPYYGNFKQIP